MSKAGRSCVSITAIDERSSSSQLGADVTAVDNHGAATSDVSSSSDYKSLARIQLPMCGQGVLVKAGMNVALQ